MEKEKNKEFSENIDVYSESEKKIMASFNKTELAAEDARKEWNKKQENAGEEFMCNSCGRKFPTEQGVKRHLSSKGGCDKEKGYRKISKAILEKEDRSAFISTVTAQEKNEIAEKVTRELRKESKSLSNVNGKRITVVDLTRCPTPSLQDMLLQADTSEIKKFVSMRFHPANASRKFIAMKELDKRK